MEKIMILLSLFIFIKLIQYSLGKFLSFIVGIVKRFTFFIRSFLILFKRFHILHTLSIFYYFSLRLIQWLNILPD